MEPNKGDIIQITSKGLFYVVELNPTMMVSLSGGPLIHLSNQEYIKIGSAIIEPKLEPPSIRKFIKECLSL